MDRFPVRSFFQIDAENLRSQSPRERPDLHHARCFLKKATVRSQASFAAASW
jgi:hypothetical protein